MKNENNKGASEEIRPELIRELAGKESAVSARRRQRKRTRATVLSAMLTALGVVILWIGYASRIADLTSVVVAAVIIVIAQVELGHPWTWMIGGATAVLSFILLPDKLLPIIYLCFGVGYPLIKRAVGRAGFVIGWIFKLIYCNLLITGIIALAKFVFMLPDDEYGFSILIYLLANAIFICGDFFIDSVTLLYARRIRPRFAGMFKGKNK